MTKPYVTIVLIFAFFSCNKKGNENSLHDRILGDWCLDERKVSIYKEKIIFNDDSLDYMFYDLFPSDSSAKLYRYRVMHNEYGFGVKILSMTTDTIIFYDSAFIKQPALLVRFRELCL